MNISFCLTCYQKIKILYLSLYTYYHLYIYFKVITRLLKYSSEVVHIQLFKLLNIICTDSMGRGYLLTFCPTIIESLITILFSFKTFTDSIFFKNILAVLQKLSLRYKV